MANWTEADYRAAVLEVERAKGGRRKPQEGLEAQGAAGKLDRVTQTLSGSYSATLPIDLLGANKLLRMQWAQRAALKQDYMALLLERHLWFSSPPPWKVKLTLTRILGPRQREYDDDNMVAACKGIIDSFKEANWFRDDSPKWLKLELAPQVSNRREYGPMVHVLVERLQEVLK